MIGDHLSQTANRKLKLWGTVVLLGFYIICVVQARQWPFYSAICGPAMMLVWIWGLSHYKRPREAGKVANFGTLLGTPSNRIVPPLVLRETPPPGGRDFQYASSVTVQLGVKKSELALEPPVRVSRYKKVSDKTKWLV